MGLLLLCLLGFFCERPKAKGSSYSHNNEDPSFIAKPIVALQYKRDLRIARTVHRLLYDVLYNDFQLSYASFLVCAVLKIQSNRTVHTFLETVISEKTPEL